MTGRIDAHHHVWDLTVRDQPWISGPDMAPLRRSFGLDDLAPLARASNVDGTVVVQTVADSTETEELLALAEAAALVRGVVGWVDLEAHDVGERLDRLLAGPGGGWLVGVRSLVQDEPDPDWLVRPRVVDGLRAVAARGLVYDLLINRHQLEAALGAVTRVPEGRFVVDHLAKPDIAGATWEPWAAGMTALGLRQNVSAKVSGLVTEASRTTWSVDDLRPYADHALATFGPDRLLFGSDWPVCCLAATYPEVVAAAEALTGSLSPAERAVVFGGTAVEVYGARLSKAGAVR